ncbi:His-Xaa-Ser system protein HxsD [Meridianimaribacter flavus]|uniref:His-Xaa-Ser system protein HxsD n=1 Tax=Meridianimaribacter flavus TaxID=571115 RepID=A0ABY2G6G8_9FLAO|nr:His-Xaa-Ser system protein HxsD [Meridianimaribacter flavus]TDY12307.1 His-Xaa-Ser system protein HxsD [Meridianimaribacter flavus]
MVIVLQKSVYKLEAIRNTIYWFSKDFEILLTEDENFFNISSDDFNETIKKDFIKSLNDFSLREQINIETKDIKNLVVSKAFYPDLIKFKDIGEFDDPINILKKNGN